MVFKWIFLHQSLGGNDPIWLQKLYRIYRSRSLPLCFSGYPLRRGFQLQRLIGFQLGLLCMVPGHPDGWCLFDKFSLMKRIWKSLKVLIWLIILATRWWFQILFIFTPDPWGNDSIWLAHSFQMASKKITNELSKTQFVSEKSRKSHLSSWAPKGSNGNCSANKMCQQNFGSRLVSC